MAFVIKTLTSEDLDIIENAIIKEKLTHALRLYRGDWSDEDIAQRRLAVDADCNCFLWHIPLSREDARNRYIFFNDGDIVVFVNTGYCTFSFTYIPAVLESRMDEVKSKIAEALCYAGLWLKGNDPSDTIDFLTHVSFDTTPGVPL